MINYSSNLFLTDKTKKKIDKIKEDIEKSRFLSLACLICLAENETDVFDIIPINNLKLRKNLLDKDRKLDTDVLNILGIAENKKAAVGLCARMCAEYLEDNSQMSMREYYKQFIE